MVKKSLCLLLVLGMLMPASLAVSGEIASGKQALVKIGKSIEVPSGEEVETAVSIGGSVTVSGKVAEDIVAVGGSVYLKDTALVGGNVVSVGGSVEKAPGAIVKGDITEVSFPMAGIVAAPGILGGLALFSIVSFIGFLVLVIILVAIFTPQLGKVSAIIESFPVKTFLVGLLGFFLIVPIMVLLAISIVGIPLIPLWAILVFAAMLFGYIAAAHFIGRKVLYAFKATGKSIMLETISGIIILSLVGLIPVLGFAVKAVAVCLGLGGVAMTRFGTENGRRLKRKPSK